MHSGQPRGTLIVRFVAQDSVQAAAEALGAAQVAVEAAGVMHSVELLDSSTATAGIVAIEKAPDFAAAFETIISKLDVLVRIIDETAKVRIWDCHYPPFDIQFCRSIHM
jgi:hypothetical protein